MNDDQTHSHETAGTTLNLNKFASDPAGDTNTDASADQGQTLFIKKSAERVADPSQNQEEAFGIPLKNMLGLVAYCYIRGVFSSKEIADRLKEEPVMRKRFGRHLPDEAAIKGFRRRYAGEIEELLETAYRAFPPKDPKLSPEDGAGQTQIIRREACERMHDAFWEDAIRRHLY